MLYQFLHLRPKKRRIKLGSKESCFFAIALIFGHFLGLNAVASKSSNTQAIDHAVQYFSFAQNPNGLFAYEFDFIPSKVIHNNNIVRQAGSGFALGQVLEMSPGHKLAQGVLKNALKGYSSHTKSLKGVKVLMDKKGRAPTGATALALLSLLYYEKATADKTFAQQKAQWLNSLLSLRIPGKGFRRTPVNKNEDDYYNGESWLALSLYNALHPENEKVARVLKQLDDYFLNKYSQSPSISFYHWGMMGAEQRFKMTGDRRFLRFMIAQSEWLLENKSPKFHPLRNQCYMVEGLMAVHQSLPKAYYASFRQRLKARIDKEINKIRKLQIQEDQSYLKFPRNVRLKVPYLKKYKGAFLNHAHSTKTRIDYTQHCLSALVRLEEANKAG